MCTVNCFRTLIWVQDSNCKSFLVNTLFLNRWRSLLWEIKKTTDIKRSVYFDVQPPTNKRQTEPEQKKRHFFLKSGSKICVEANDEHTEMTGRHNRCVSYRLKEFQLSIIWWTRKEWGTTQMWHELLLTNKLVKLKNPVSHWLWLMAKQVEWRTTESSV